MQNTSELKKNLQISTEQEPLTSNMNKLISYRRLPPNKLYNL